MSNIKGTVTTLRQFLFNVESEVKTEVNGKNTQLFISKKTEFYLSQTIKEKSVGKKKLCSR